MAKKSLKDKVTEGASNVALNMGAAKGLFELSEYMNSQDFASETQLLALGGGAIGTYLANQKGLFSKASEKINKAREYISENWKPKATNAISTLILGGTLALGGLTLNNEISNAYQDFSGENEKKEVVEKENNPNSSDSSKNKQEINSSRLSLEGKFERAARFDHVYERMEEKYNLPENTLPALAMTESHGNPVQLNTPGDGGAGLYQFQPGTARRYGLNVRGSSRSSGADTTHAKKLKEIAEKHDYNYEKLAKADDRFHVPKASDAAARYIDDLMNKYGDLDDAILAYNQGYSIDNPETTEHVRRFDKCREYYKENIGDFKKEYEAKTEK